MEQQKEQILRELTEWGCDVPGTMRRFLNDSDFYCRLLRSVPQESSFEELGKALEAGDVRTAFELAHSLKGVLGNMGISPMYQECCAIVEPLRAGSAEGVREHYQTLLGQRERLSAILNAKA